MKRLYAETTSRSEMSGPIMYGELIKRDVDLAGLLLGFPTLHPRRDPVARLRRKQCPTKKLNSPSRATAKRFLPAII